MTDGKKKFIGKCAKGIGFVGGTVLVSELTVNAYADPVIDNKAWKALAFVGAWGVACMVAEKVGEYAEDFALTCIDLAEIGIDAIKEL